MSQMPMVYVAGPFRAKDAWGIECHIREAENLGLKVASLGAVPVIPHTMYRFFQGSLPDEFWLQAGLALLRACSSVVVTTTELGSKVSAGTTAEIAEARRLGLPIFFAGEVIDVQRLKGASTG